MKKSNKKLGRKLMRTAEAMIKAQHPPGATAITEKMGVHKLWYKEAKKQTVETLPAFIQKLTSDFGHDYGTICHAIAAAAVGAAWAVEHSPQGGITGFQSGAVVWEFYYAWTGERGPMRLLKYDEILYPQYEYKFNSISNDIWKEIVIKAAVNLKNDTLVHPEVKKHWEKIANGIVPFGLKVRNEE